MAHMITLLDGRTEAIFDDDNAFELVERYAGSDLSIIIKCILDEKNAEIDELKDDIDDMKNDQADAQRIEGICFRAFEEIRKHIEDQDEYFLAPDGDKILEILRKAEQSSDN